MIEKEESLIDKELNNKNQIISNNENKKSNDSNDHNNYYVVFMNNNLNVRITIKDIDSGIDGDYMIKSYSIPFNVNGTIQSNGKCLFFNNCCITIN